jgi:hypothetical protein
MRHVAYAGGWKKFEPFWDVAIGTGQVLHVLPLLETILAGFGEPQRRARIPSRGSVEAVRPQRLELVDQAVLHVHGLSKLVD